MRGFAPCLFPWTYISKEREEYKFAPVTKVRTTAPGWISFNSGCESPRYVHITKKLKNN